ncbi:MAG TPA: ATP-dependent sacrificial sulfur transferase LarE [Acidimicrobiales bacterium]|nr:ATP-dependent sacrificial sulfur transferase LarE [Acidimicrobiales bacterium]
MSPEASLLSGTDLLPEDLKGKVRVLEQSLGALDRVMVAFSGGSDSALLAWMATQVLGKDRATCRTAVSSSLATEELRDCEQLAVEWSLDWAPIATDELDKPKYVENGSDRCYHCKTELMDKLLPEANSLGATIVLGVNLDDLGDHRPGQDAAFEKGASFPLVDAGLTKDQIRQVSKIAGLRTWNKPAAACLASRIPYGTKVSIGLLAQVDHAEGALKSLGFSQLRVRHYGQTARIELDIQEFGKAIDMRSEIVRVIKAAGFNYVTIDLEGFRSGNLNSEVNGAS